jgi:DNA-binding response OmpR family regulator
VPKVLEKSGISLHVDTHKTYYHGSEILLKPREFALLEFLMLNANLVFSPEALKDRLWSFDDDVAGTGIRVLISRLRNKLGGESSPVKNVYGVGYTFQSEA